MFPQLFEGWNTLRHKDETGLTSVSVSKDGNLIVMHF